MSNVQENKQMFLSVVRNNIKRPGIENLIDFLEKSDFFEAPCSTKFHLCERGGLCEHSLNVYTTLLSLAKEFTTSTPEMNESYAIVSLFHDLCKVYYYREEMKPVKVGSSWTQQKVYVTDDKLPLGHGEKSVMILLRFIELTNEEMLAIRWHMGAFDCAVKGGEWSMNTAKEKSKLVTLLQCADMIASHIIEA